MTYPSSILYLTKLKPAKFNTHLFSIIDYDMMDKHLEQLVKIFNNRQYIYIKNKYCKDMVDKKNYVVKMYFNDFIDDEGKTKYWIVGIRDKSSITRYKYKLADLVDRLGMVIITNSSDSENEEKKEEI